VRVPFRVRAHHAVGWQRGWKSRVATAMLRLPGARRVSQMIVLEVEPA
jgi:hypothetical protein